MRFVDSLQRSCKGDESVVWRVEAWPSVTLSATWRAARASVGCLALAARPFSPTLQAGAAVRSQEWGRVRTPEMPQLPVDAPFRPHS
jgi:hypothetical protein